MKVTVLVLNAQGEPHFQATDHVNLEHLFQFAKDREGVAREKGLEWTTGFVTANSLDLEAVSKRRNRSLESIPAD